ncbi:unnamed protein product, partial [Ectocarpus fasciculatus]
MSGFTTPQWIAFTFLAAVIGCLFCFARSDSKHTTARSEEAQRGGTAQQDHHATGATSETNVPLAYHEAAVRNGGQVPRGSVAAMVAGNAATPAVREAYQQHGGYVPKGSPAARMQSEEAVRMRPRPAANSSFTFGSGFSTA